MSTFAFLHASFTSSFIIFNNKNDNIYNIIYNTYKYQNFPGEINYFLEISNKKTRCLTLLINRVKVGTYFIFNVIRILKNCGH